MKKNDNIFSRHTCKHCSLLFAFCAMFALCTTSDGAVVSRGQRPTTTARMPTMSAMINTTASNTSVSTPETESSDVESETEIVIEPEPEIIIEDKTSQFDEFMADSTPTTDTSSESLAAQIRAQRAALDAADAASAAANQMATARASGQNACDANLRECMKQKCGNDYSKCAGDTDTMWGTKMDACRRDLPCSGHEYALFSAQIKADRDMNARIASYNSIVDCGNRYNNCIVTECGQKFTKCLGKRAGDAAISKCEKIAKTCTQQDSGLASRTLNVFGTLRVDAEKQVAADEKRLYELRDKMRDTCGRLGAMFDDRTLDCVYTVNFFAGEDNTLYASKKAYAGSTFSCDQNWFGVDITTFKENAFRLTRTQTSATSALMGSGIGMATGAITSGAIDRAIDRHKAEKALKDAESEHEELYGPVTGDDDTDDENDTKPGAAERRCKRANGTWENNTCTGAVCGKNKEWDSTKNKCVKSKDSGEDTDNDSSERPDNETAKKNCEAVGGTWDKICKDPKCGDNALWDDWTGKCKEYAAGEKPATFTEQETACKIFGTWTGTTCMCNNMGKWNASKKCANATHKPKNSKTGNVNLSLLAQQTPAQPAHNLIWGHATWATDKKKNQQP